MNVTVLSLMLAAVIAPPAKTSNERSTRIYVRTTPPGASILLDGKELGTSDGLFLVPPGVRKITLEMIGYDPEAQTVDVKEGWITRVEVRMVKKAAGKILDRDARVEEIKKMLARDTKKLDELLQSHGKQHPMVRLLEARIQAWKQTLEDPTIEGTFDRLDERAAEYLRKIESATNRSRGTQVLTSSDFDRAIHDLSEGVLEFRVAANEEEAKAFAETGEGLGWYDSLMKDANNLVTRQHEGKIQVLLWKTPEKSMTRSNGQGKKWQVIQVSVIAEPDKPGRVGVVFDEEGGRRLKKLTTDNIDRQMAILVDGRVMNCPTVRAPISSRVEITGNFSKTDLNRVATALQAGMEPIRPVVPKPEP